MQPGDEEKVREAVKRAFPPVDQELSRDLWPAMLRRLQEGEERPSSTVPWYDWALAAGLAGVLLLFPKLALLLAYHL